MRRSLSLSLILALAGLAQTPTAEQIVDRHLEVTGGRAAHEKIRTETMTGLMEMRAQGIKGRMTGFKNDRNESYNSVEIDGVGKIEEGFHNGIAWEKSAMAGPRIKTGEEKAFFAREAAAGKEARWRDFYSKAELTGEEPVGGVDCFKVVLTPKDGARAETRFYEKGSGRLKRVTMVMATPMGDLPVDSTFADYKEFGGIQVPTAIQTRMAGQQMSMSINSVEYNKEIPAEKMIPPPDVRALAEKQSKKAN
jgi:hypothetical protein